MLQGLPAELDSLGVSTGSKGIVLVLVDASIYVDATLLLLKRLANMRCDIIYVTVNRPYQSLVSLLDNNGIDTERMFFIDAITESVGGKAERTENCLYVGSPSRLTDLGIGFEEAIKSLGETEKYLFFDSLSTLAIYNNVQTVTQFGHFLTVRLRLHNVKGVLMAVESESDLALIKTLTYLSDSCVRLKQ